MLLSDGLIVPLMNDACDNDRSKLGQHWSGGVLATERLQLGHTHGMRLANADSSASQLERWGDVYCELVWNHIGVEPVQPIGPNGNDAPSRLPVQIRPGVESARHTACEDGDTSDLARKERSGQLVNQIRGSFEGSYSPVLLVSPHKHR